jgi:hypothetical protein
MPRSGVGADRASHGSGWTEFLGCGSPESLRIGAKLRHRIRIFPTEVTEGSPRRRAEKTEDGRVLAQSSQRSQRGAGLTGRIRAPTRVVAHRIRPAFAGRRIGNSKQGSRTPKDIRGSALGSPFAIFANFANFAREFRSFSALCATASPASRGASPRENSAPRFFSILRDLRGYFRFGSLV